MVEPSGATRPADPGSSTVLQVLGALGTGVGVLGFVAAIGGMIVHTRADAAGLPAEQATAVEQGVAADHHASDCERRADRLASWAKQMRAEHAEASTKVQWVVRVAVGVALLVLQLLALAVLGAGADGVGQWLVLLLL